MRNTYLIDFENVGSEGLNGVATLTAEDRVILFYSANSNRMTVRAHQAIVASPAQFDYFEVAVGGKNALDHQLGTYLGYMVATNASERYFIVSHDNGFKFLSAFWLSRDANLQISMTDTIKASFRVRPSERPRPVSQQNLPKQEPVNEEPKAEAPVVEAKTEFAAETPAMPEPAAESPFAAFSPEPVPQMPVAEAQTQPELSSAPAKESAPSVEQKTDDAVSAGPLPVLGSQSRSRSNSARGRVRSESILATLRTTKPLTQAAPADVEDVPTAVPAEETKPVILEAEPTAEPTVAIAEVAAEALEATAPVEETTAKEVPAEEPVAEFKPSRNRNRHRRSNSRKDAEPKAESPAQSKAEASPVAEPETIGAEEAPSEEPKAEPKPAKKSARAEKFTEPKPYTMSDTASAALTALLADHPKVNESRVRELIASSKKQILCNTLRRQLGQEQGLAIYNQIKKIAYR